MALTFSASVTRSSLGLGDLNIHDGVNYTMSSSIMSGSIAWQRNQVSSPYVDGDVTVTRRRPNISEQLPIYVYGADHAEVATNVATLLNAFLQNSYNLGITVGNQLYQYQCEAADYQMDWNHARMHSTQTLVNLQVPRRPVAVSGV